jgi:P-type E1-E2 ATPase
MAEGIELEIPGWRRLVLRQLVLDVNGVLALDGELVPAVPERIAALGAVLDVHLLSADTYGQLADIAATVGGSATRLRPGDEAAQKAEFVRSLGAASVVAIGNGANDIAMLEEAALGIAVLGFEGASPAALLAGDIVAGSVHEALDLLLQPVRLVATLRR